MHSRTRRCCERKKSSERNICTAKEGIVAELKTSMRFFGECLRNCRGLHSGGREAES